MNKTIFFMICILCILAIIFVCYMNEIAKNKDKISLVSPHVYISSYEVANDYNILQKYNIRHVLTILSDSSSNVMTHYPFVNYLRVYKVDIFFENIKDSFDDTYKFIDNAVSKGENILVHCYAGMSRSPTIVAAYLMLKYNMTADQALEQIKHGRNIASPNFGFVNQLGQYEKELKL